MIDCWFARPLEGRNLPSNGMGKTVGRTVWWDKIRSSDFGAVDGLQTSKWVFQVGNWIRES